MVATTALVFLSLSDHRAAINADGVDAAPRSASTVSSPPALSVATPAGASTVVVDASVARPRDRLVMATISPERGIVEALMPSAGGPNGPSASTAVVVAKLDAEKDSSAAADTTPDTTPETMRDWDGDAFVGPLPPSVDEVPVAEIELEDASEEAIDAAVDPQLAPGIVEPVSAAAAIAETPVASATQKPEMRRHPLGFDPLREPALTGSTAKERAAGKKGLADLIATEEEHTVRYTRDIVHEVRKGETLSTVLSSHGVGRTDTANWLTTVRKQFNPNRIYPGQTITLSVDMPDNQLRRLKFDLGKDGSLVVDGTGIGTTIAAKQKPAAAASRESNIRVVEGEITSSLYAVANAKGVPDRIISDAAEVLGWEINLGRDLQRGARFRLAYEETMRVDAREPWAGKLLAIELRNQGKHYEGFYFATADGKTSGYYNRKGQGLGRAFLRYPVSFSRVSSQFSMSRYHPVLKRSRPHYGVDFAAPTGTPVKAAADGVVTMAGWHGGNGRFVKIRHDKQYESGYSHLSRIASGMRPGARVKQGQVIGYVGSTGLATGPHLHFAMYSYGKYVDPMKTSLPRTMPLAGTSLASFKSQVSKVEKVYAANGMGPFGTASVATASASNGTRQ